MNSLCRHFGTCGGCLYQDQPDEAYRALKRNIVVEAAARAGLDAYVEEVVPVAPATRRRATFKAAKSAGVTALGFYAASSHDIVDMRECLVLTTRLFALVPGLRDMMDALLKDGEKAEVHVTDADNGPDVAIRWPKPRTAALVAVAAQWARKLKFARLSANGEPLFLSETPFVSIGAARVPLPVESFLQATAEGEALLTTKVLEGAKDAKSVLDLFAGVGTFTIPLAARAKIHAVEADAGALASLTEAFRHASGLKPVTTERRDLYKLPLTQPELSRFDCAILDPPRAGALAQAKELAKSALKRVVYVSCNAASFARDARVLVDGGYGLGTVSPIDQFLWSSHIEVAATFTRT